MENDFTFSRDYRALFNDAKKIKNVDRMAEIFNELCSEIGAKDERADMSSSAAGKRLAEMLNQRGKGPDCKKV